MRRCPLLTSPRVIRILRKVIDHNDQAKLVKMASKKGSFIQSVGTTLEKQKHEPVPVYAPPFVFFFSLSLDPCCGQSLTGEFPGIAPCGAEHAGRGGANGPSGTRVPDGDTGTRVPEEEVRPSS